MSILRINICNLLRLLCFMVKLFNSGQPGGLTQFKHYLDKIQVFAATELSITLPDPDDYHWETFYKYYIDKL